MQSLTRCGTIRTTIKKNDGKVFLFHSTRHESLFDNNLCMLCFCSICDILWFLDGIRSRESEKRKLSSHPMRKTGQKIIDYLRLVLYVLMIDVLGLMVFPFYSIPFFVVLLTLGILLREGWSMKENYELKQSNAVEAIDMAAEIVKCITKEEAEKLIKAINDKHSINKKKFKWLWHN